MMFCQGIHLNTIVFQVDKRFEIFQILYIHSKRMGGYDILSL